MSNTICYTYHGTTGQYLFQETCQIDPIDGGTLMPANSTLTAPPSSIDEGKVAVWENNAWTQKFDYRGQQAFNSVSGMFEEITFLGDLPTGWSWDAPTE